jgi:hypothetical protein
MDVLEELMDWGSLREEMVMFTVKLDRDRIMSVEGKRSSMFDLDWFLRFLGVECKLGVVIGDEGTLVSTEWKRLVR